MNEPSKLRASQPGLETAYSTDPEVVDPPGEKFAFPTSSPGIVYEWYGSPQTYAEASYNSYQSPYGTYDGKEVGTQPLPPPPPPPPPPSPPPPPLPAKGADGSRRRLLIWVGVVIAIIVIVGSVVGGVLGSKASIDGSKAANSQSAAAESTSSRLSSPSATPSSTSSPSSSNSPLLSPSTSVNTTAVRPGTRLSITGRRVPGNGFTSRLFWQGGDNKIRSSRYSSDKSSWSDPVVYDELDAQPGTPIAATEYLQFPQFEVFFLDPKLTFRGVNFGEDETVPKVDSINTARPLFTVPDTSRLAGYFPYVIYQNPNGTFHRVVYDGHGGRGWFNDLLTGWFNDDIPVGDTNTGLAVVPVVRNFVSPYAAGIVYRDGKGHLSIFSFGGVDTGVAWYSGIPEITIPKGTAIAALTVGRTDSNVTNTWILYQDGSNKIQSLWQDDDNEWNGPQEVGEADAGTDIACLTEQVGDQPQVITLSDRTDMSRCYYQFKGTILEKRLGTNNKWVDGAMVITG